MRCGYWQCLTPELTRAAVLAIHIRDNPKRRRVERIVRLQSWGRMKIELVIELSVAPEINPYRGEQTDSSEVEWFEDHLLADELILHSNLIGSEVGTVRVVKRCAT